MDDEERKKFWRRRNPFFDLFSEFDKMDDAMDAMMKRTFDEMPSGKPMSYGFSMKIGPDGKPKIREFGNVKPSQKKLAKLPTEKESSKSETNIKITKNKCKGFLCFEGFRKGVNIRIQLERYALQHQPKMVLTSFEKKENKISSKPKTLKTL